jgi:guanine nucleotide-binding protein G(I)/G(S)/G(T) subunit beta-1
MSSDLTGEQMQAKITAARREAEGLKDKIKRKKDDLADTSCKLPDTTSRSPRARIANQYGFIQCDKSPSTIPKPCHG